MNYNQNNYLLNLLQYQQDGAGSISGPRTWDIKPLFDIETPLTSEVVENVKSYLETDRVIWQFLIGSPGNGKSHLVGKIYKELKDTLKLVHDEIDPNENLPYKLEWKKRGDKFSKIWFVQDASAVEDIYSEKADDADDLKNVLIDAVGKKVSLVVCANRGVLERVVAKANIDEKKTPWYRAAEFAIDLTETNKIDIGKKGDEKCTLKKNAADAQSLFSNSGAIVNEILNEALADNNWSECSTCAAKDVCPFYSNKQSLDDPEWRKITIEILRNTELLSGQMVVFRELLALISIIFAGASKDYDEHPCLWVEKRAKANSYLSLLTKRFYFEFFASFDLYGIDSASFDWRRSKIILGNLANKLSGDQKNELNLFIKQTTPTTDVGITRLLGRKGFITIQDPVCSGLRYDFLSEWSCDNPEILTNLDNLSGPTTLEQKATSTFVDYLKILETNPPSEVNEIISFIQRVSSAFLLRIAGLSNRKTRFSGSLKKFTTIINALDTDTRPLPNETRRLLNEWGSKLDTVLNSLTETTEKNEIRLTEVLTVKGDAMLKHKKIIIGEELEPPKIRLSCYFGTVDKDSVDLYLDGMVYAWIDTVETDGLIPQSIPSDLLDALLQSQTIAVSSSDFSRSAEELTFSIDGRTTKLIGEYNDAWIGGEPE
jgi:hypothetical protein